jgi:serine/threonine protein kinase/tetratricopeptide (TPR) repeat protein
MNEESLFAAALERPTPADRQAFLDEVCGDDTALRERVEQLLAADRQTRGILERDPDIGVATPPEPLVADRIFANRFKLRQKLGEGGMGEVWVADQIEPVRRRVALKVVRPGFDSARLLTRFEQERQALALMDHPNIARVLDAGVSDSRPGAPADVSGPIGRPYFVMELIEGVPITDYCDANRLTLRERLELFIPICQAVQHAHQKGVIHRDLKPSNILVAQYDDKPVPKVIDFGVAKAIGPRLTDESVYTEVGLLIGTLEYMSPEQAELNNLDVDTRSDVYALGAILYEMLTGSVPFPREELHGLPLSEILRRIREVDPPRPSVRLSGSVTLLAVATARQAEPRNLPALVRGDLDWIVMKCLEKDRSRRYESATGLAQDVQRYLADEVVAARPPSTAYRTRKFIRRNRGRVAAAVALSVTLAAGLGAVATVRAAANRDRTAAATDRATRAAAATAGVTEALRDARERAEEAWELQDYPDRMQRATDAAVAAIRRADDFAASGPPHEEALAELAVTRRAVGELVRATRLTTTHVDDQLRFANSSLDDVDTYKQITAVCVRHREVLRQYGLDPLNSPIDEVAQAVATSRIRDPILGILMEWRHLKMLVSKSGAKFEGDRADEARLREVVLSTRLLCGGIHARWQELTDRANVQGLLDFANSPEALSLRPPLARALGRDLWWRGWRGPAHTYLRAAVERYPHDVWLRYDLGAACMALQSPDYAEAVQHLAVASVLRPGNAAFHLELSRCYTRLGSHERAETAAREAFSLRPDSAIARATLASSLSKMRARQALFRWFEGKWERVATSEGAPFREAVRVVMECPVLEDPVFTYYGLNQVLHAHDATVKVERNDAVTSLVCTVVKVRTGQGKLKATETTICRIDNDTFCEVGGISSGQGTGWPQPYVATWKRVRDK